MSRAAAFMDVAVAPSGVRIGNTVIGKVCAATMVASPTGARTEDRRANYGSHPEGVAKRLWGIDLIFDDAPDFPWLEEFFSR